MGIYQNARGGGESVENLHPSKEAMDAEGSISSNHDKVRERGKTLVSITFIVELLIVAGVIALEYVLRWTSVFPMRRLNFTCTDPELSYTENDPTVSTMTFKAVVPTDVVYSLTLCVPPFVMIIGEVAVWAFTDDNQKSLRMCCGGCNVPQIFRRLFRFIGVFVFGLVSLMVFVDVIKMTTGRLRPNFLEVCAVNSTLCAINGQVGGDELCTNKDRIAIRHARGSFPSMRSAMTAFAAIYLSIYIHGALRTRSVRVLRPFMSLMFTMLALLCGLSELALHHNFWTDIVVGWALGIALAIYLGAFVLYNFKEYVSEKKMIRLLHGFLVDHQLLNEITKDGKLRLFPYPFHIPRAHTRSSPYGPKFEGIRYQDTPLSIHGIESENPGDKYRGRPTPHPNMAEQGLEHL